MCLFVKGPRKIRIATKNIVVWKRLHPLGNGKYISPCAEFKYFKGRVYTPVELQIDGWHCVEAGFHAHRTKKASQADWWYTPTDVVRMIIPKGSKYVLGTDNEIVSSHIRFPRKGE